MDEINNDFDNLYKCNLNKDIFNKIDDLYNKSINDMSNLINEYKEKYKIFKKNIEEYLNEKAKNVIKIFNLKNNLNFHFCIIFFNFDLRLYISISNFSISVLKG